MIFDFETEGILEPLHPVVQLKFGVADFIVTIPPKFLQEFTAISTCAGQDNASFVFVDPTFTKIEKLILQTDRKAANLLYRWGYPGNGLEKSHWRKGIINTYQPTLSGSGCRINLNLIAVGSEYATLIEPTVYVGRISTVALKIAKEMGFADKDIFIEETDDEENEIKKTEWYSANQTRIDILYSLARIARSKTNPNLAFSFKLGSVGTFHFHTPGHAPATDHEKKLDKVTLKKQYRKFQILFGQPMGGISFTPEYDAQQIGSFAQSVIGTTFDPRTKQFKKRIYDRDQIGMTRKDDPKNARTTSPPLVKSRDISQLEKKANARVHVPSRQVAMGGRCSGRTTHRHIAPDMAFNKIENAFKYLHENVTRGTLELVALPEYADFTQDELYTDIYVVLPPESIGDNIVPSSTIDQEVRDAYAGLHWSSGRYYIETVTHTITTGYQISAELIRQTMLDGPADAKTGPPKKPALLTVGST